MLPASKRKLAVLLALWAALCLCLALIYGFPPATGDLVQSDDYMRMARVQALLDGHPGRNFNEPRMGPAGGAGNAWSPLPDLPLAALVIVFDLFVDRAGAMLWTAALFPPLLLLGFIFACGWAARQGLGERDARWAPAALLLLWPALLPFAPGRVDHHNWQLIALALAFGCLLRARRDPENVKFPAIAGALGALGWSLSGEAVPWAGLAAGVTGIFWLAGGPRFAPPGFIYAAALLAATIVLVPVTRSAAGFFAAECDGISLAYIALAAAALLFWIIMRLVPARLLEGWRGRLLCGGLAAGALTAGLYALFPGCARDPVGVGDPELRRIWFDRVTETMPAAAFAGQPLLLLFYIGPLLLALGVCLFRLRRGGEPLLWAALAFAMAAALGLGLWQIRTAYLGQALAAVPLAALLASGARRLAAAPAPRTETQSRKRRRLAILFFCVMLAFAAQALRGRDAPAEKPRGAIAPACDLASAARVLNTVPEERTIAAYVIDGPELLYRTRHRVLAASFQRDAEGIIAAHGILMAANDETARALADKYDVGLVMVCEGHLGYWKRMAQTDDPFAARLWRGEAPPWLRLLGSGKGFRVYAVKED